MHTDAMNQSVNHSGHLHRVGVRHTVVPGRLVQPHRVVRRDLVEVGGRDVSRRSASLPSSHPNPLTHSPGFSVATCAAMRFFTSSMDVMVASLRRQG